MDKELREKLFTDNDEHEFKKQFVIQYLAAYIATSNIKDREIPPVREARKKANESWNAWVEKIGTVTYVLET